jgi:hypothetical protein
MKTITTNDALDLTRKRAYELIEEHTLSIPYSELIPTEQLVSRVLMELVAKYLKQELGRTPK